MKDLTMEQAALILGVSRQTLYNRLGELPPGSSARDIVDAELGKLKDQIRDIEQKIKLTATPAASGEFQG